MGFGTTNIDRLLPRHQSVVSLDLTWDVRHERDGMFKKIEVSDVAVIRDISLEGALVEVKSKLNHTVGEKVAVRFREFDGTAVIRHCRDGEEDGGSAFYGVRFIGDRDFVEMLSTAVGELRGHSAELSRAWLRPN